MITHSSNMIIRASRDDDMPTVQAIYAHHVLNGKASFEEVPPDLAEMQARRRAILDKELPYLVAEKEGRVLGYAYASFYRPRSAYRYTLEDSIYLAQDAIGQGIGASLLDRIVEIATQQGYRQMIAIIGDSANQASIAVHRRAGFEQVGTLKEVGLKFGQWVDSVIMQKALKQSL